VIQRSDYIRHEGLDYDQVAGMFVVRYALRASAMTYLIETPKHLVAIAASKNTAARGNVSSAIAKKDARRCGAFVAASDSRYRPKAATDPENMQVIIPGIIPAEAIA
jgi:hypothetical protein